MDNPTYYAREAAAAMGCLSAILREGGFSQGAWRDLDRLTHLLHTDKHYDALRAYDQLRFFGMGSLYDNDYGVLGEPLGVNGHVVASVACLLIGMARERMERLREALPAEPAS